MILSATPEVMVRAPGTSEDRDLSWLDSSTLPVLSRDGRFIAMCDIGDSGGPNYSVCLRETDGSPMVRLGEGSPVAFSPDDRWVAAIVRSSPARLMVYPTGTGEGRRVDRGQLEAYNDAQWVSDGKTLLVSGNEPGHAPRCYVMALEGGDVRAVTPEGTESGLPSHRALHAR